MWMRSKRQLPGSPPMRVLFKAAAKVDAPPRPGPAANCALNMARAQPRAAGNAWDNLSPEVVCCQCHSTQLPQLSLPPGI